MTCAEAARRDTADADYFGCHRWMALRAMRSRTASVLYGRAMLVTSVETWWVAGERALFDAARRGSARMDWDVVVLRLTADSGEQGVATCLAARSGQVTEAYLTDTVAPVVLGRSPHDRERIWHDLWNIDRHLAFFPVFLPGPVDVALWDMAARSAGLPLYQYIGAYRESLPVYASGGFHGSVDDYVDEAKKYRDRGITAYKAHPPGPVSVDMEVHRRLRAELGPDQVLMSDPVGTYTLDQAIRVGRQLEELEFAWFEEPFRDFELHKYAELCRVLDIPVAAVCAIKIEGTMHPLIRTIRLHHAVLRIVDVQLPGKHHLASAGHTFDPLRLGFCLGQCWQGCNPFRRGER